MYIEYLTRENICEYMERHRNSLLEFAECKGIPLIVKDKTRRNAESWNPDNIRDYEQNEDEIIVTMNNGEQLCFYDDDCKGITADDSEWIIFMYEKMLVFGLGENYKSFILTDRKDLGNRIASAVQDLQARAWKGTTVNIDLDKNTVTEGEYIPELIDKWAQEAGEAFDSETKYLEDSFDEIDGGYGK